MANNILVVCEERQDDLTLSAHRTKHRAPDWGRPALTDLRDMQLGTLWRRHKRRGLAGLDLAAPEHHRAPSDFSFQLVVVSARATESGGKGGPQSDQRAAQENKLQCY